jgi:hypothetical protein
MKAKFWLLALYASGIVTGFGIYNALAQQYHRCAIRDDGVLRCAGIKDGEIVKLYGVRANIERGADSTKSSPTPPSADEYISPIAPQRPDDGTDL